MIEEQALVTRVVPGQVWIKRSQANACGGCIQQSSCGTATLSKILPRREFAIACDMSLQVGDSVRIAIDDSHLLFSCLLLYLLPLLGMLLSVLVANSLLPSEIVDLWLPLIALSTLLLMFRLIHQFQAILLIAICYRPEIVGKV